MISRLTCLLVFAAFALAPLAQAVDCVMHVPVAGHGAAHGDSHAEHKDHDRGQRMVVADCFAAAMDAVGSSDAGFGFKPQLADVMLAPEPVWVARTDAPPLQVVMVPWRGPPPDVLQVNRRLRI